LTPEEETDALFEALGRGEIPSGEPAVRLLAVLVRDVLEADGPRHPSPCGQAGRSRVSVLDDSSELGDGGRPGAAPLDGVGQRRSSVSMTPST
jgi:hypothetical protein